MRSYALAFVCIAGAACGGADTTLNGVFPASGFSGRTLRVEVSADNANFGGSATIDFGAGITVGQVTVASPTALFADITISDSTAPGLHSITVKGGGDTLTLTDAFKVESPIKVDFQGQLAQGSVSFFTVRNLDFASPFDDTCTAASLFGCSEYGNVQVDAPPGTTAIIDSVSPYALTGTLYIDTDAASGPFAVHSGPSTGTVITSTLGVDTAITARTATAFDTMTTATLANAYDTHLYSLTAGANSLNRFTISGDSQNVRVYLLGSSGSWADLRGGGAKPNVISQPGEMMYAVVFDGSGDSGYAYTLRNQPLTLTPVAEAANDTQGAAQAVSATALVTGASLSSDTDEDWYAITVPSNSSTKKVHVITAAGDPYTDTAVTVYASNGTTELLAETDDNYHESVVSSAVGSNNTVYVKISASSYFDPSQKNYVAAIWLE